MYKISFYNTKSYDKISFDKLKNEYQMDIEYHKYKLNEKTVKFAEGSDAVVAFVNDTINEKVIDKLCEYGIGVIAMR